MERSKPITYLLIGMLFLQAMSPFSKAQVTPKLLPLAAMGVTAANNTNTLKELLHSVKLPTPTATPTPTPKPTATPTPVPLGKKHAQKPGNLTFSYPEPAPINTDTSTYTLLVNKEYVLPSGFIPYMVEPNVEIYHKKINERRYLQPIAATALEELFSAAEVDGLHLVLRCGFRSYQLQKSIYSYQLKYRGYMEASRYHAFAGSSEHQTGLAVDLCCEATNYENNMKILDTPEYSWLLENAHLYGWILRYPEDKTHITGYNFEPWHFRYVGTELATYIKEHNITLEEYYGAIPTKSLLVVPKEYWHLISDADYELMMKDIADFEAAHATPTPTPKPTKPPKATPSPAPEENPTPTPSEVTEPEETPTPTPSEVTEPEETPTPTPSETTGPEETPTPTPSEATEPEKTPTPKPPKTPKATPSPAPEENPMPTPSETTEPETPMTPTPTPEPAIP